MRAGVGTPRALLARFAQQGAKGAVLFHQDVRLAVPHLADDRVVTNAHVVAGTDLANMDLVLNAAVTSTTADPANADNAATASVQIIAEADLAISASSAGNVDVGGIATYSITVDNLGVDDAQFAGVALVFGGLVSPTVTPPGGWTCDAPVQDAYSTEDLLHAGRAERLPPGEGQIDLPAILRRLPPDLPLALEVPMTAYAREAGTEAVARRARRSR